MRKRGPDRAKEREGERNR